MPIRNLLSRARLAALAVALTVALWFSASAGPSAAEAACAPADARGHRVFRAARSPALRAKLPEVSRRKAAGRFATRLAHSAIAGGDSGPAIVAGNPQGSLLMQALRYQDEIKMPPDGKLPPEVIAAIETWISRALPGRPSPRRPRRSKRSTLGRRIGRCSRCASPHFRPWPAYRGPARRSDYFILSKLEQRGLSPSDAADRRTLIRRATFDLTGLPVDSGRDRRFPFRSRARRFRSRRRAAAGFAALRRALGAALARRGPLCRHQGLLVHARTATIPTPIAIAIGSCRA